MVMTVALAQELTLQHHVVEIANDGEAGWRLAESHTYDLIVLDLMLPRLDGISLCQRLRRSGYQKPILLLTGCDSSASKVKGLDAGADDYVVKPFDWSELLARIRALLRREGEPLASVLQWGDLRLNPATCEVTYTEKLLTLRPKEYSLLELFLRNPRRIFSCGAILEHLWSFEDPPGEETVRAHIKGLRQKLKTVGVADLIETVYGLGYRLNSPEAGQGGRGALQAEEELPSQESRVPSLQEALAEAWEELKPNVLKQVVVLEEAVAAVLLGRLSAEVRRQASSEAHKLAGLVGSFGFSKGTELSRQIEDLLQSELSLNRDRVQSLKEWVVALRQELFGNALAAKVQSSAVSEIQTTRYSPDAHYLSDARPLLFVVDDDRALVEQLTVESVSWGIDISAIGDLCAANVLITEKRPDVVLLNLCCSQTKADALALLAELKALDPPLPVLVLSSGEKMSNRLEVIRLGIKGSAFLQKPVSASQVFEAASQALQHTQANAGKILVVDDDPQMLSMLRTILTPWGLTVRTLTDPRVFWDILEKVSPDLLILDVEMPHSSGIELCQLVRNDSRWAGLPVLFLTAHTDTETVQEVFAAGADDFACKPIVGPELVTRIVTRIERSRLWRRLAETDALTQLANRSKFTSELNRFLQMAERLAQPLCLAVLDLDNLKQINYQYSYGTGDAVLRRVGELLGRAFHNGEDAVARWGGKKFVIGMYGLDKIEGVQWLRQVLAALHQEVFTASNGDRFQVTFSVGVADYPGDGTDLEALYRAAEIAVDLAKAAAN